MNWSLDVGGLGSGCVAGRRQLQGSRAGCCHPEPVVHQIFHWPARRRICRCAGPSRRGAAPRRARGRRFGWRVPSAVRADRRPRSASAGVGRGASWHATARHPTRRKQRGMQLTWYDNNLPVCRRQPGPVSQGDTTAGETRSAGPAGLSRSSTRGPVPVGDGRRSPSYPGYCRRAWRRFRDCPSGWRDTALAYIPGHVRGGQGAGIPTRVPGHRPLPRPAIPATMTSRRSGSDLSHAWRAGISPRPLQSWHKKDLRVAGDDGAEIGRVNYSCSNASGQSRRSKPRERLAEVRHVQDNSE